MFIYKRAGIFFNRIVMVFNIFKCFFTDYSIGQIKNARFASSFIFPNSSNIVEYMVNFIKVFY